MTLSRGLNRRNMLTMKRKSQLAIEHVYRTRERSPETWVFWVHASNAARFEQSYRDIAESVKIAGRQSPQANIFKLVHDRLRDSKERWMIVLDNVDDARFLLDIQDNGQGQSADASNTTARPLREYLPHCEQGSILVTTRNKEAALKLVDQRDIVFVAPMDKLQAQALFEKKLGIQDNSHVAELAEALEYMPLAIAQASAYISQRAPRCSVAKYLDEFKKSERKRSNLLARDEGQLRRDWEAKNSIIVTWQISFEHIQRIRPSAADLLSLMSFFDRQGIPEAALRTGYENSRADEQEYREDYPDGDDHDDSSQSSADDRFEDDLLELRNFCFVSMDSNSTTFEMHALVQLATRKWLETNGTLEKWKQQFISTLCEAFPTGEYENWPTCEPLFAHAQSAAEQRPESESSLEDWATLLFRTAWYTWRKGNVAATKELAVKSMIAHQKLLGRENGHTLNSMILVGTAYHMEGRLDKAEEIEAEIMEIRTKKLGENHRDTLASMANLASTYWKQGRWKEAEKLEVKVVEKFRRTLGVNDYDTLASMTNLAATYRSQGRWDEAEELQLQVMEAHRKKVGENHPDTLHSMDHLASTYRNQGRWDEAEKLQLHVMETSMRELGVGHPGTLDSMSNLASTYRNQGRWNEAEELQVQVLDIHTKKFGVEHTETLTEMARLAMTYRNQGRWDEAEELQVKVLEIRKKNFGENYPDTVNIMCSLAFTWKSQGREADALSLLKEGIRLQHKILGADHPYYIGYLETLTEWEAEQGNTER